VEVTEILLVLAAVSLGFFAKGITGVGGPVLAIPVLASIQGVEYAVAVIAIPALFANTWLLWEHRATAGSVSRFLRPLLIAGALGVMLGAWILVNVDERILSAALALFVLAYIVWYATSRELHLSEQLATRAAAPVGFVGGALQGSTGISAPVIATYVHSLRLPRAGFIFAVTLPFQVLGMVQVVSMATLGVYTTERLVAAAFAIIPVVIVLPLAMRVGTRLSQRAFEITVLVVLGATALRLLWTVFE